MTESDEPKRGRGRPRMRPADAARRNIGIQVSADLYEVIKQHAEASGRSLSREMEFGLEQFFSGSTEAVAQQALADAIEEARAKEFEEIQNDFGGFLSFTTARQWVESFNVELRKASVGSEDALSFLLDEHKVLEFSQALSSHIPGLVAHLSGMAKFSQIISGVTQHDIDKIFDHIKKDPELRARFERAISKSADAGHK